MQRCTNDIYMECIQISLSDVFLWLFDLANVFHFTFISFVLATIISFHLLYGLCFYTVSGNKPPSSSNWLVGFCRHFKSPHSFHTSSLSIVHFCLCKYSYHPPSLSREAIIIIIIIKLIGCGMPEVGITCIT